MGHEFYCHLNCKATSYICSKKCCDLLVMPAVSEWDHLGEFSNSGNSCWRPIVTVTLNPYLSCVKEKCLEASAGPKESPKGEFSQRSSITQLLEVRDSHSVLGARNKSYIIRLSVRVTWIL